MTNSLCKILLCPATVFVREGMQNAPLPLAPFIMRRCRFVRTQSSPKPEEDEVHDDKDLFGSAEDMESVDMTDDEFDTHNYVQGIVNSNTRVHGPSKFSLSELLAQSDDEEFDVHSNEAHSFGPNTFGIGASALSNSAVFGAVSPGSSSLLASATYNH